MFIEYRNIYIYSIYIEYDFQLEPCTKETCSAESAESSQWWWGIDWILQWEGTCVTKNDSKTSLSKEKGWNWELRGVERLCSIIPSYLGRNFGYKFATWGSKKEAGDWTQATSKCPAFQRGWGGPVFRQFFFPASLARHIKDVRNMLLHQQSAS